MLLNWSFLIVAFALGLIGIWVSYSFLNKNGLYLFITLASIISFSLYNSNIFSLQISASTVILPLIFFSLLTCFNKYGKEEAKKLFFISLISMLSCFAFLFFQAAYSDSILNSQQFLTWSYLGIFISQIISFTVSSALTLFLTTKIKANKLKKFLQLSIFLAIASSIYVVIDSIFVFTGALAFGSLLLIILIKIIITCLISLFLGYFEKFLNREPKQETVVQPQKQEEIKIETVENTEEIKSPEDID